MGDHTKIIFFFLDAFFLSPLPSPTNFQHMPQVVQLQGTERMQALAPTVKEINEKFGQNKEAATAATNRLYKETNVNPLIGCLPALLQVCVYMPLSAYMRKYY